MTLHCWHENERGVCLKEPGHIARHKYVEQDEVRHVIALERGVVLEHVHYGTLETAQRPAKLCTCGAMLRGPAELRDHLAKFPAVEAPA